MASRTVDTTIPHLEGCPESRPEAWTAVKAVKTVDEVGVERIAHQTVSVLRCSDCAQQVVVGDGGRAANALNEEIHAQGLSETAT